MDLESEINDDDDDDCYFLYLSSKCNQALAKIVDRMLEQNNAGFAQPASRRFITLTFSYPGVSYRSSL